MKSFKVNKKLESEPTVFGMALIPFFVTISMAILWIFALLISRSFWVLTIGVAVTMGTLFLANYVYNNKVIDRMSDAEQPKHLINDIF